MSLLEILREEAHRRDLLQPGEAIDAARAFELVRDMPYLRASDRRPETTIREWRGTCSGKHYLLKALFEELGLKSRLIAASHTFHIDPEEAPEDLRADLEAADGQVVDIHNYLVLELPEGEMIVDATWPLGSDRYGLTVNEAFVLGQNQETACLPGRIWVVPEDSDPQALKDRLLEEAFTWGELDLRDRVIRALGEAVK